MTSATSTVIFAGNTHIQFDKATPIDVFASVRITQLGDYAQVRTMPFSDDIHLGTTDNTSDDDTSNGDKNKSGKPANPNKEKPTDKPANPKKKPRQGKPSTRSAGGTKATAEHNQNSAKRAIRKFKNLVLTNAPHNRFRRHIILNYSGFMSNWNRVDKDFNRFIRQLQQETNQHFSYLYIVEPDDLGRWHIHLILIADDSKISLSKATVAKCWQHGPLDMQSIYDLYGLVQYFNISFRQVEEGEEMTKAQKKGSRVHFYPPNARIYRRSRDIVDPTIQKMTYGKALELLKGFSLFAAWTMYVLNEENYQIAHFQTEIYENSILSDPEKGIKCPNYLIEPENLPLKEE